MPQDSFFQIGHDDLSFRCRIDGPGGSAPWLVFANSILTDLSIWDHQVTALAGQYNIFRYDQRGHGGTDVPGSGSTFDELGSDLAHLLGHCGIERCTFVGLSMGVPTGLWLVRNSGLDVEQMVLTDGQYATAPGGAALWQARIEDAERSNPHETAKVFIERWFSPEFRQSGRADPVLRMAEAVPTKGFSACASALQNYDFSDMIDKLDLPALLIAGLNDGNMPVSMQAFANRLPNARFKAIENAGHLPNWEQSELYTRELVSFLLDV